MADANSESDIKSWLALILKKDNISNLSVNVVGSSEKGDGYMGDIVFVHATGTAEGGLTKEYSLVLKCSKRSLILRQTTAVTAMFANEIFFYDQLLPSFIQFQNDKNVEKPFNSVPKSYGTFTAENVEVIALENLKKRGFALWPAKQPVTRNHIDLVVKEYAKFHAISVAMKEQQPEDFQKLVDIVECNTKNFYKMRTNMLKAFESCIDEVHDILKNDLDAHVLLKWKTFKEQVSVILKDIQNITGLKVVAHGDCWNNNFMYKYENMDNKMPSEVAILDWQVVKYSSPILDLSYFLFTCISEDDIENLEDVLRNYHTTFADQLKKLGTNHGMYPLTQFLDDWKKYCKFGIMMSSVLLKVCCREKDEVVDVAENAESGKDFGQVFLQEVKDSDNFKNRMRPIVDYVVKHELI